MCDFGDPARPFSNLISHILRSVRLPAQKRQYVDGPKRLNFLFHFANPTSRRQNLGP